jgi:hypothetical protein
MIFGSVRIGRQDARYDLLHISVELSFLFALVIALRWVETTIAAATGVLPS